MLSKLSYVASNYTGMGLGNVYKGAIDANSVILSQLSRFYVYPSSPADLEAEARLQ